MKRRIAMIQPYFGFLPNYFDLALKSYAFNADFDWYIFTDDRSHHDYPPNVFVTHTTLDRLKSRFQQHFDFPIMLGFPYKCCDYRPMYGHLFADHLQGYDFWGHFDPDVLFGDLNKFLTDEIIQLNNKVGVKGHFALYRNIPAINLLYQQKVAGCMYYRDVISHEENWGFDERDCGVNAIFAANRLQIHDGCPVADIHFRDYAMRLLGGTSAEAEKSRRSCFAYERGGVYRYYWFENQIHREEFMYIHLMKRKMDVLCRSTSSCLIYANGFREAKPVTRDLLESANRDRFFYRFRDKLRFLYTYRIKPACQLLFVERDYRKFIGKVAEKSRLGGRYLRKV